MAYGVDVARVRGNGGYSPTEDWLLWYPKNNKTTDLRVPVIAIHGGSGVPDQFADAVNDDVPKGLADHGLPVISIMGGGGNTWGNNVVKAAIGAALTFMGTRVGATTTRVGLYGLSHGGPCVLNYAWDVANSSKVVGCAMVCPVVNITLFQSTNQLGLGAAISAAYAAEGGLAAGLAAHDPLNHYADIALIRTKVRGWYGDADAFCPPAESLAFARGTGVEMTAMAGVSHVSNPSDPDEVVRWLAKRCLWP